MNVVFQLFFSLNCLLSISYSLLSTLAINLTVTASGCFGLTLLSSIHFFSTDTLVVSSEPIVTVPLLPIPPPLVFDLLPLINTFLRFEVNSLPSSSVCKPRYSLFLLRIPLCLLSSKGELSLFFQL